VGLDHAPTICELLARGVWTARWAQSIVVEGTSREVMWHVFVREPWAPSLYICFLLLVLLIGSQSSRAQPAGEWTHVIPLPSIPIAAALLPDGRVLGWSSNTLTFFELDIGATPSQTFTSLTTPQSGQYPMTPDWGRPELVTNPPHDMFCPGTAYLPNGQLLV